MASRPQSRPPPPVSRPPPPFSQVTGPPPTTSPPAVPLTNLNTRKFSLQNVPPPPQGSAPPGPGASALQQVNPPQQQGLPPFKRPPEKMEDNRFQKFGDSKLRSPSPARGAGANFNRPPPPSSHGSIERKISAPANLTNSATLSPVPPGFSSMNGNSSDMQCFMNLLEREETDFVEQVKKSKAFIKSVIRQAHIFHLW